MTKSQTTQTAKAQNMVKVFNIEIENKNYNTKELVNLVRNHFDELETVGHVSYFILGLKHLGLIKDSYAMIAAIVNKLFELKGLKTNTTEKCQGWYYQQIKKGKVNINEEFKQGRKKQTITTEQIDELFA